MSKFNLLPYQLFVDNYYMLKTVLRTIKYLYKMILLLNQLNLKCWMQDR